MVFAQTAIFIEDWKALKLDDEALRSPKTMLMEHPDAGDVISNTGGVRKVRFALPGRGKSGSSRIVYLYMPNQSQIFLLLAFGKNEQANPSAEDKAFCRKMVAAIKRSLVKGPR